MSPFQSISKLMHTAVLAGAVVLVAAGWAHGQTDLAIELREAQATLQASSARITELEARLTRAKDQINSLAEALASANGDSQQAREAFENLRTQMEGLGMASLEGSDAALQQRLLTALSDLRILEGQKRALATALMELTESSLAFARETVNVEGAPKQALNGGIAKAEAVLRSLQGEASAADEGQLHHARVVSLKEDAGVVVLNVGLRQGVHPGMPFSIYREDKPVARALVVDVRQGICGAVIQELVSKGDPVKVGDTGKVDAQKS